jgi:hypothetical protein
MQRSCFAPAFDGYSLAGIGFIAAVRRFSRAELMAILNQAGIKVSQGIRLDGLPFPAKCFCSTLFEIQRQLWATSQPGVEAGQAH